MVIFVKQEKAYKAEALRLLFLILSLTLSLFTKKNLSKCIQSLFLFGLFHFILLLDNVSITQSFKCLFYFLLLPLWQKVNSISKIQLR